MTKGAYSRKLTEEQLDQVAARYRAGASLLELSFAFDCSQTCIRNALILRGVTRRQPGRVGPARLNFTPKKRRATC